MSGWWQRRFTCCVSAKFLFHRLLEREGVDRGAKIFPLGHFSVFGNDEMMLFEMDDADSVLLIFCSISSFVSESSCRMSFICFGDPLFTWRRQSLCKILHVPLCSSSFSFLRLILNQDHYLLLNFPMMCFQKMDLNQLTIILVEKNNFHRQTHYPRAELVLH